MQAINNSMTRLARIGCLLLIMLGSAQALAGDLVVTRYFSGLWDQPKQESQGIVLQIIDQEENGNPKAVAYWFTYGDDLETSWYMAIGHVDGDQVVLTLYTAWGVGFMEDDIPDVSHVDVVGDLILTFRNCNHGMANYTLNDSMGEFEISKLAGLYNARCSGGISDNTPQGAKPLMMEVKLFPPEEAAPGEGKAKFWQRTERSDFIVSAEGISDGSYDIFVCDGENPVGTLTVNGGEGSTHFRSPAQEGKENLTFEPQGCPVELRLGETVVLTSGDEVLEEKSKGNGGDEDSVDELKVEIDLDNTGVLADAEGEAEYEVKNGRREFEVEISGVPAGDYGLTVGDAFNGIISVAEDGEKGKLKFSDPPKMGREPLDFVPWEMDIEVMSGADVILMATFPPE
jgi:hypothetical protein